jgi:hypothetical protein
VAPAPLFPANEFDKINAINTFRRRAGDWQKRSVNFGQLSDACPLNTDDDGDLDD